MEQNKNNTKASKWEQLDYNKRLKIEALAEAKKSASEIAKQLGYSKRTIERELRRGKVVLRYTKYDPIAIEAHMPREYEEREKYSADIAQKAHDEAGSAKGKQLKLGSRHDFAEYIEQKIGKERLSPYAALAQAKIEKRSFAGLVCFKTLYNYIDNNYFLNIGNKDLWVKKDKKKRKYNKIRPAYNNKKGRSIEERPPETLKRLELGHWEMDTVVGKGKTCLLVLTERMYRKEIIIKLKSRSQKEVVNALDKLERRWGKRKFRATFKSITSDNGGEFLSQEGIETSCLNRKKKRTIMYFCHPYSAWERGSNENANKMIRRFIPKGANIAEYTEKEIMRIENYMNNYPRKLLNGLTPNSLYEKHIA